MWREQDAARGLSGPDGVLLSVSRPLSGSGCRTKWSAADDGGGQGGACYGYLQTASRQQLQAIATACTPDDIMDKVRLVCMQQGVTELLAWQLWCLVTDTAEYHPKYQMSLT